MSQPLLFTPLSLRGVTLKNRVAIAPMLQYASVDGFANDWHLMNVGRYAAGGAGLVIMESTNVERRGAGTAGGLGLWNDDFIPSLKRCADFVKNHGSIPGIQLGHTGRRARHAKPWEGGRPLKERIATYDWEGWEPVGPSAIPAGPGAHLPRALRHDEIVRLIEAWGETADRAHRAGFEVLELHGAHGYLIHQFLSPEANRRDDAYGGSPAKRMRFCIEVVESVRARWPEDKPLFLRLSVEDDAGWDLAQSIALARIVKEKGVDVIDCSSGGMTRSAVQSASPVTYGHQVPYARRIRAEAGIASMAVGLIVHATQAEAILQEGDADLIAIAREALYNPNWAMDAAQKLGADPDFTCVPPAQAYWLAKRARSARDVVPSTFPAPSIQVGDARNTATSE